MNFYKQHDDTSCHLIALQTILSFYGKYPSVAEIKKSLPKHSFGNLLPELGSYLEKQGIGTTIVTNNAPVRVGNRQFKDLRLVSLL
jgi:ABC-type bacteriocin/lantibiotic exporter with double-glycine peptidase domain